MYHSYPTYCPRCDTLTPILHLDHHPKSTFAIYTRTTHCPIKLDTPPLVKYCEPCSHGGVDALKTGITLSMYLRKSHDENYAFMVQQSIETQRIHQEELDLAHRMQPHMGGENDHGAQDGVQGLEEDVKEMVHPSSLPQRPRRSKKFLDEVEWGQECQNRVRIIKIMVCMKLPESPRQQARREKTKAEKQRRFEREKEKLVRVGKMWLGGDPAWADAIGPYSDDGTLELEMEEGWFKVNVVKPVWFWLKPEQRGLETGFSE
ncbi:hypothetical protein MMC30_002275 [Trapelia coarctata]|nr:hypothetical protein [Trapelia coarctata]